MPATAWARAYMGAGAGLHSPFTTAQQHPPLCRPLHLLHLLHLLHAAPTPPGAFLQPFATQTKSLQMTAAACVCCRAMCDLCALYIQKRVVEKNFARTQLRNGANLPNACSRVYKRGKKA